MRSRLGTILLIALLGSTLQAGAAEGGDFTIAPVRPQPKDPRDQSYFVYQADPDQVINDQFLVKNLTDAPLILALYGVDAAVSTDGGFAPLQRGATNEVGGWISIPVDSVTLDPQEVRVIDVMFHVPANATGGDHVGAVMAEENKGGQPAAGGQGLNVLLRVGIRVYVTVSGVPGTRSFSAGPPKYSESVGQGFIGVPLDNTGNLIVEPTAKVTLEGTCPFEKQFPVVGTLLPGAHLDSSLPLGGRPCPGDYNATITFNDLAGNITQIARGPISVVDVGPATSIPSPTPVGPLAAEKASSVPWWLAVLAGLIVLGVLGFFLFFILRRRNEDEEERRRRAKVA